MSKRKKQGITVGRVAPRKNIQTGKPRVLPRGAQRSKMASSAPPAYMSLSGGGGSSFGIGTGRTSAGGGFSRGSTANGAGGNFYSPELSTDFLELPQSRDEKRNYFRFFYATDPMVGQAIDIHVDLPLSKIRMGRAKAKNVDLSQKSLMFCQRWAEEVDLLGFLRYLLHEWYLLGEAYVWAEDDSPDMPQEVTHQRVYKYDEETGEADEVWEERPDADDRAIKWLKQNYFGWTDLDILPPERVQTQSFAFTKEKLYSLIPSKDETNLISQADAGDQDAKRIVDSMPKEIVNAIRLGEGVRLNTDPDAGSFLYHLTRKKSKYETHGHSILERCLRVLVYRDKLRQAQTSIASRHMTPIRIVWVEDGDVYDVEDLREQVDLALMDPDYSIVTNFEVNWEEMGADQRLLDLGTEYDQTDRMLYSGLGVTESLLSGESSYSGDRINLEVINTRYMAVREMVSRFVERFLLMPMCKRMGFIEEDEDGNEVILYPTVGFTRLALRDNADTFDTLFNLYQKGSLDIDVIYELLNIDPIIATEKLEQQMFTMKDSQFNEFLRGLYGDASRALVESSNLPEFLARQISNMVGYTIEYNPPDEGGGGRFASDQQEDDGEERVPRQRDPDPDPPASDLSEQALERVAEIAARAASEAVLRSLKEVEGASA